jgi:DNA-binding transcriptional ArsR family regulator
LSRSNSARAEVFAALGDSTRLTLVSKLMDGRTHSISTLTTGTKMSRQAVTKHLTVLEGAGLVSKVKDGRESLYALETKPIEDIREYLDVIAKQWDKALLSLKTFVEEDL